MLRFHFLRRVLSSKSLLLLSVTRIGAHTDTTLETETLMFSQLPFNWPHCDDENVAVLKASGQSFCVRSKRKQRIMTWDPEGFNITTKVFSILLWAIHKVNVCLSFCQHRHYLFTGGRYSLFFSAFLRLLIVGSNTWSVGLKSLWKMAYSKSRC